MGGGGGEKGEHTLDSGGGKFQILTIFLGILQSEAMPASSEQLRAVVGSYVTIFRNSMADRARKAAALRIRTLTVPLKVRASDVLVLFLIGLLLMCGDIEQNPEPGEKGPSQISSTSAAYH